MEAYEIYLLLHVVSVIVWLGGGIMVQLFAMRVLGANDDARLLGFARDMEVVNRVFPIAGVSTLIWGVLMVIESPAWEFEQAWIVLGFLGIALGAILGSAVYGPRLRAGIEQLANGDAAGRAAVQRIGRIAQFEIVFLLIVVWAMVAKPGF